jgi:1,4-alpha-glucan branching enzyme
MGCELAQWDEWSESRGLDWATLGDAGHAGVLQTVRDLNEVYRATPALWELDHEPAGFQWLVADDAGANVIAYVRRDRAGRPLVAVINFAGNPHDGYRLPLPHGGAWREVLNTDAPVYGGSGVGNLGEVHAEEVSAGGLAFSASVRLPPLGALFLVPAQ